LILNYLFLNRMQVDAVRLPLPISYMFPLP